jgi:hypothetical protein
MIRFFPTTMTQIGFVTEFSVTGRGKRPKPVGAVVVVKKPRPYDNIVLNRRGEACLAQPANRMEAHSHV